MCIRDRQLITGDLEFTLIEDDLNYGSLNPNTDALLGSISNNTGRVGTVIANTYTDISVSGGSGTGAVATVVTTDTDVTSVTIIPNDSHYTTAGSGYAIGDVLTISATDIGRESGNDLVFTLVADDIDDGTLKLDTDYLMSRITGNRACTGEICGTYSDIVVNGGNNDAKATIVTAYNEVTPTYAYSSFLDIYTPTELYDNETQIFTPQEMKQIGYFARQILTSQYSYSNIRLSTKIDDSENFITVTNNQHNDEDEGTFFALGMLPIESWVNVFGSIPASTGTIYQVYKNNRSSSQVDIIAYSDGCLLYTSPSPRDS